MDVGVGNYSDPEGLEGLAHFLGNKFLTSFSFIFYFFLTEDFFDVEVFIPLSFLHADVDFVSLS